MALLVLCTLNHPRGGLELRKENQNEMIKEDPVRNLRAALGATTVRVLVLVPYSGWPLPVLSSLVPDSPKAEERYQRRWITEY